MSPDISFQICFPLDLQLHAKKFFLPLLDKYMDAIEDLLSVISRHYEYSPIFNRQLSNISSDSFIYRINVALRGPLQLNLDNFITKNTVAALLNKVIGNFFQMENREVFLTSINATSVSLEMDKSFLYSPLRHSVLEDKINKILELQNSINHKPELLQKTS